MFVFIFANFLVIPLALMTHPDAGALAHHTFVPGIQGGVTSEAVLLIIAIVGTTVAPWQLFFQQSNVVDKRITPRWINYERADTVIGAFIVVVGAGAMIAVTAYGLGGTPAAGHFTDAGGVAAALRRYVSPTAGAFFAVVLLNASMIGAAAVTLSTTYAFGDVFGTRHSLHRGIREAKLFYASFSALVALAAAIVLIPGAPLGIITEAVQALAGILLPSATVFLLLLCNDRAVLGPWVNPGWLNALSGVIVAVLVMLSMILMATTLFPGIDVTKLATDLGIALVVALAAAGAYSLRPGRPRLPAPEVPESERRTWTMPPLALLERPTWSPARKAGMATLWVYLILAVALLVVKAVQLAS